MRLALTPGAEDTARLSGGEARRVGVSGVRVSASSFWFKAEGGG